MTSTLAVAKAAELPEADQERIGGELLGYIEALAKLRAELQIGIDELDAGLGQEIDAEEPLAELHREHAAR
jgi:hypothetical protein